MNAAKIDFSKIKNILKWGYIVETILILVGVVLRLKLYLSNPSFYIDECSLGYNILTKKYSELFLLLDRNQCAAPLFLVISKFILNISHQSGNLYTQDLALRAFTLFCSIMSLPLFAIFLNKITDNKIFVWVCVGMLSLNTNAINYSIQFKQYSCELMVSLILLVTFQFFDINKLSKKTLCLYSFVFCISIWFSNMAIVVLTAGFVCFILKCFSSKFRKEVIANLSKVAIIGTSFCINLAIYYNFYFKAIYYSCIRDYMLNFWENDWPSFFSFNNFFSLFPLKLQYFITIPYISCNAVIIFIIFNLIALFLAKKGLNFKTKVFVLTPILITIIASFLNLYPFENRLILYSLPLYTILYCQLIFLIKPNVFFKTLTILILAIVSICKLNMPISSIYHALFYQPARATAEFIIQNKIPANKIILDISDTPYYLYYYLPNNKPVLLYDGYWIKFKDSEIPKTLKNASLGDYYIFIPTSNLNHEYHYGVIQYLNNDKHLKILNTYTKNGFTYIIHVKKISSYD